MATGPIPQSLRDFIAKNYQKGSDKKSLDERTAALEVAAEQRFKHLKEIQKAQEVLAAMNGRAKTTTGVTPPGWGTYNTVTGLVSGQVTSGAVIGTNTFLQHPPVELSFVPDQEDAHSIEVEGDEIVIRARGAYKTSPSPHGKAIVLEHRLTKEEAQKIASELMRAAAKVQIRTDEACPSIGEGRPVSLGGRPACRTIQG